MKLFAARREALVVFQAAGIAGPGSVALGVYHSDALSFLNGAVALGMLFGRTYRLLPGRSGAAYRAATSALNACCKSSYG